ncbi:type I restriction endonuclease subunit R [Actinomycetota bacterium]
MIFDNDEAELELAALELLADLGWTTADVYGETFPNGELGREHPGEVVLVERLSAAVASLNPSLDEYARADAVEQMTRARPPGSAVATNRDVRNLLRDGAKVQTTASDGTSNTATVRYVDWDDPPANDWLAVRQFKVDGDMYKTRADIVGFVNGIPLLFIELKAPHVGVKHAFDDNLSHYRDAIPQLFWFNGICILSNGGDTKVGSFSAPWDHFGEWKRVDSEDEPPSTSIETALRGVAEPSRLLDLVENFTLFQEVPGGLIKILGKNHQVLGVNSALEALHDIEGNQGRLGVFWHTQGSGKSFSMILFAQKALRKVSGKFSFVIVTDRKDLDDQIYKNFVSTGAITEPKGNHTGPQATSGSHLQELLRGDHRYVFTLIQKFQTETGEIYPTLSERDDIIVMADEAHRTQYDTLALNLRNALPNAAFLAFTGTPLMAGEEETKGVFGDYVSVYNFRESINDGATVPLYYENRSPEVQLVNEDFDRDMQNILEAAELDEDQEKRLAREFSREYHLITDDDRLETVAVDLVDHFLSRGHQGKAMVISIDKATAVKMYDKVQAEWQRRTNELIQDIEASTGDRREALEDKLAEMTATDMAVVVSPSHNEITDMAAKGVDIEPHRKRMVEEDLDVRFKDPEDLLRIVFVCAMWLTGFDAPATSTIYLDKPMRNHTLMQTIARANRVFQNKESGDIVDYVGVFRNLQEALAIYGSASGGGVEAGDMPVESKDEQAQQLANDLTGLTEFCLKIGVELNEGIGVSGFDWVAWLGSSAEAVLRSDDTRRGYLARADICATRWRALKPHPVATDAQPVMSVIVRLSQRVRMETGTPDVSGVMAEVEQLLEESVDAVPFVIDASAVTRVNLAEIDFDALAALFASGKQATAAARLQASLEQKIARMMRTNPMRLNYREKLSDMIDQYNNGSKNIEEFFQELKELADSLSDEEERHVREGLTEEELAVFDVLTKPEPKLSKREEAQVKAIVRELLDKLKSELLILDWKKRQSSRAAVQVGIETALDDGLPEAYTAELFGEKTARVFEHVFDAYQGDGLSIYEAA